MSLTAGTRIGPYEITALIGKGGMGEVYRASDTKLARHVAIKVLPDAEAADTDRLARFDREAKTLAALNHPNIAQVYGLETSDGTTALVMELVEGLTLADRIERGAIPVDEALPIAKQLTEALEAAHEHGIIHRDLKPSNIKVRPDGTVKVLDFGLAKMRDPDVALTGASLVPTVTSPAATRAGVILGTAAYMAPEQATGRAVDRRADIWAFGVVLFEMLTGTRLFEGESINEVISEILKTEPDWSRLPLDTPASIRRLLRRCLQKDRARRLHDIADARLEVDEASDRSLPDGGATTTPTNWRWIAALVLVGGIAVVQSVRSGRSTPAIASETRLEMTTPAPLAEGSPGGETMPESMAISPDGTKIVLAAAGDGRLQLWLRSLDSIAWRPLSGSDNAVRPFWSPDSRSIAFFADGQLKRIDIDGGTTRTLARAVLGVGGSWSGDGTILFGPIFSGPLYRVSSDGGEPTPVTRLAPGQAHHRLPRFLPDNRHFVYAVPGDGIYLGDLVGSEPRRLLDAQYAELHTPSGRLLFLRQGTVFSQPFDTSSMILTGTAVPVADQAVALSVSSAGPIVYRRLPVLGRYQFIWFDRTGKQLAQVGEPIGGQGDPDLSYDGRYIALSRIVDGNADSWILDTMRGVFTRFTFEPAANYSPRWSPDGKRIVFNSNKSGVYDLYIKSAIGDGPEELLLSTPQNKSATDWSPDGRYLLFRSVDPDTGHDLWAMEVDGDRKPFPVVRTSFVEAYGQFSPDGKWIAYQSNESGRFEIYTQPFPGPGPKQQVSRSGGAQIRWKSDGSELYYIDPDSQLMAVPIRSSTDTLDIGDATTLFTVRIGEIVPLQSGYSLAYVVAPDGRFLVSTELENSLPSPVTVILNWRAPR